MKEKEKYYFITYQIHYIVGTTRIFNVITNRRIPDWYLRERKRLKKYNEQPKELRPYTDKSKSNTDIKKMIILFFKELTKEEFLEFEEVTDIELSP